MDRKLLATMDCPNAVTWKNEIAKMFTAMDVAHMKKVSHGTLDLGNYESVKMWASKIYDEVSSGEMPPPGSGEDSWTGDMVKTFGCWIKQGCPEG